MRTILRRLRLDAPRYAPAGAPVGSTPPGAPAFIPDAGARSLCYHGKPPDLTRGIGRLRRYARDVTEGRRSDPPQTSALELSEALGAMRERLECKQLAESHLYGLTHELRCLLAAIRGAARLHKGSVRVDSTGGLGTCACSRLPFST